jgi:hypothetical protein
MKRLDDKHAEVEKTRLLDRGPCASCGAWVLSSKGCRPGGFFHAPKRLSLARRDHPIPAICSPPTLMARAGAGKRQCAGRQRRARARARPRALRAASFHRSRTESVIPSTFQECQGWRAPFAP